MYIDHADQNTKIKKDIKAAAKRTCGRSTETLITSVTLYNVLLQDSLFYLWYIYIYESVPYKYQGKHALEFCRVETLELQKNIGVHCSVINDTWRFHVLARISSIYDLAAEEAIYHKVCSSNFQ